MGSSRENDSVPARAEDRAVRFLGSVVPPTDIELVREVVTSCPGLSRTELSLTIAELLGHRRRNGRLKGPECLDLLEKLERAGVVSLPPLQKGARRGIAKSVPKTADGEPRPPLVGRVDEFGPVSLVRVTTADQRLRFRELVGRYHYLGIKVPFGAYLRYLVWLARPEPQIVGCLQFSSAAWRMAARDAWIGWSDERRAAHLQRIVNNSRFLILPWIQVKNLASSILAAAVRTLPHDWEQAFAVEPLLLETLVDPARFNGGCYRAANWVELGLTTGRGRMDRYRDTEKHAKLIFVHPLRRGAVGRLRGERKGSGQQQGTSDETAS